MSDRASDAVSRRLKRANGHLEKIIEMIEQGQPCAKVAQQLQAVENAIDSAKQLLIHDHIAHSLDAAAGTNAKVQAVTRNLKLMTKYL
ncbi:metal-sensing transcriptional repressor [Rhodopseudomonas boonkerdii]|uniref:metal-sensing transcriptional repressor n=1 Tax=Rhodopseudomonas boonkerdii TaxID=475937 RepID=UPI001E5990ED|nr:metal-sensing transcriptional repressor [Rhodopseudomonas boonkerdii]UGV26794.1 metal-sensing transcriptional repressor [Rhodopseudomonas boonkerdii]